MKVPASVRRQKVIVLIDSGSTHNFISDRIAGRLQVPVIPMPAFSIKVANRDPMKCSDRFEHVSISLQGIPFSLTFYSLPLIGFDVV